MNKFISIWVGFLLIGLLMVGGAALHIFDPVKQGMITIGVARWSRHPEYGRNIDGFKQGLAENGFVEGENIRFMHKNPETKLVRQQEIIKEFIALDVNLIYSLTTPGTMIAKNETNRMEFPIPVVFSIAAYPVESNLIASLESSGNNLVGTRNYVPFSHQYYSFERIYPHTKVLAVVYLKGDPNSNNQLKEVKELLFKRGIRVVNIAVADDEDLREQLNAKRGMIDSIFSTCGTLTQHGVEDVMIEFSKTYKKPSFTCDKEGVLKGHLIGNVGDYKAIGRIAGEKAALILKGSKPSWLTTEALRENYIVINKNTADTMGLPVPKELLEIAKEIVFN